MIPSKLISWVASKVGRGILFSAVIIGSATLLVKLVAMSKEIIVANQFGVGESLDAFLIAYLLPSFMINVLGGSLSVSLIPVFVRVREQQGQKLAIKLFSTVFTLFLALLFTVAVLLSAIVPVIIPVLGSGFSDPVTELSKSLSYLLIPLLVINGIKYLYASVLNAGERFLIVALAPVVIPAAVIVVVLMSADEIGVYALVLGTIVGSIVEVFILLWASSRAEISGFPKWKGLTSDVKNVIDQYFRKVGSSSIMTANMLADQAMAAMLVVGSVSVLSYGTRITTMLSGLGATALGTAVLPYFSKMVALEDWESIRRVTRRYLGLVIIVSMPFVLILYLMSDNLVRLIFEGGEFGSDDTLIVGRVQALYIIQIPFYVLGVMYIRLISALNGNRYLVKIAVINLAVNVSGNFFLMQEYGVAGIALSTSVMYIVSLFISMHYVRRLIRPCFPAW